MISQWKIDWNKGVVKASIFAMCVVDTWLVYNGCKQSDDAAQMNEQQAHSTQKEFYTLLAEELIDNSYDEVRRRRQSTGESTFSDRALLIREDGLPRSGLSAHLTPTKRRKVDPAGNQTKHHWQGRCNVCKLKSTQLCSVCSDNGKTVYICGTRKGQICFAEHMQSKHGQEGSVNI